MVIAYEICCIDHQIEGSQTLDVWFIEMGNLKEPAHENKMNSLLLVIPVYV